MRRLLPIVCLVVGCSGSPAPGSPHDAAIIGDDGSDVGTDATTGGDLPLSEVGGADTMPFDAGAPDGDAADISPDARPAACADHSPAGCFDDPDCVLLQSCVDDLGNTAPFSGSVDGLWDVTARSIGEKGLPDGEVGGKLSLYRVDDEAVRGLLVLPDHRLSHRLWGGVGPNGDLGLRFGTPECDDEALCAATFEAAYDASGEARPEEIVVDEVQADESVIDFRTFVELVATPSDGFKPVGPALSQRENPVASSWYGGLMVLDGATPMLLTCSIQISGTPGDYVVPSFECDDDGSRPARFDSADASSIAYADGRLWLAFGPSVDDLLLVGETDVSSPWSGVVVRRGDVWNNGPPVAPSDVAIDHVRGTFEFSAVP